MGKLRNAKIWAKDGDYANAMLILKEGFEIENLKKLIHNSN